MALTRDFKNSVVARVGRDPAFAKALLDEAATLFLSGDPETARLAKSGVARPWRSRSSNWREYSGPWMP
jgi:hypothetical protein